jgi:hypothetical protein
MPLERLNIVMSDYGHGAFLALLCQQCDHRRWYRGQLMRRLALRAAAVEEERATNARPDIWPSAAYYAPSSFKDLS